MDQCPQAAKSCPKLQPSNPDQDSPTDRISSVMPLASHQQAADISLAG